MTWEVVDLAGVQFGRRERVTTIIRLMNQELLTGIFTAFGLGFGRTECIHSASAVRCCVIPPDPAQPTLTHFRILDHFDA
jgi:hypothetical protein